MKVLGTSKRQLLHYSRDKIAVLSRCSIDANIRRDSGKLYPFLSLLQRVRVHAFSELI